ncbi:MAG: hypothetical protein LC749_06005 [Actinobacteria bacterium]|nr:hypothetical protein [Actinomycetota bacterium]
MGVGLGHRRPRAGDQDVLHATSRRSTSVEPGLLVNQAFAADIGAYGEISPHVRGGTAAAPAVECWY